MADMRRTKAPKASPAKTALVYERPWLYPKQRDAIFDCVDKDGKASRYAFIEASTKAGKTSACIAWLFEQAIINGGPGRNYWWVAPVYLQAKIAYKRMKLGLPGWMFKAHETDLTITLPNGAVIWFKSAEKPDNLYGDDVHAAVLDEASRMREEAWHAMRSTLTATRGPIRCIGNVKGRKNWFYRLARMAEAGSEGMSHALLNAWDAVKGGVLDAEEIEDARRTLPEHVFNELYLAKAGDDDGNPFGSSYIEAATIPDFSELPAVAYGVDLAKSVDWTVVIGLDRNGAVCGLARWQKKPWEETVSRIKEIVGHKPALVDSTGVGDPIVEALQKGRHNVEGFTFSGPSKQKLMEGLALGIQTGTCRFPKGPITAELDLFEYVYTRTGVRYSAPTGYHDDCVMALGLAREKWTSVTPAMLGDALPIGIDRIAPWLDNTLATGGEA